MNVSYRLLVIIIFAEFAAVALIIVATYILKFYFLLKNIKKQRLKIKIDNYFKILLKENYNTKKFSKRWHKIEILLPIIQKLNKTSNQNWPELKDKLFHEVLLPQARKNAYSWFWLNRYMAIQVFVQKIETKDDGYVIKLVNDRVPIVALNAIPLAIKSNSEIAINIVIDKMAKERRLAQGIFLKEFKNSQATVVPIIEKRLKTEKDPYVRATCYKLLKSFPKKYKIIPKNIKKDINSKTLELSLNSIKYLNHLNKKDAEPILNVLLKSKTWQVRVAAIQTLADFKDKKYIHEIANSLEDPNWWVRFNSATALKQYGEPGLKVLKTRDPNKDLYAYEAAQHVLQVHSIEDMD